MSNDTINRTREAAEAAMVEAAWAQWAVLTSAALPADRRRSWTIIDPEALVLASLAVGQRERRLDDMAASWGAGAAHLMSLHRMRVVASMFPVAVGERLHVFARAAVAAGDKRWKQLVESQATAKEHARTKPLGELRLHEGPALTLKLRAGFGVNAKADLLAVLIGFRKAASDLKGIAAADLKVIAAATGYTDRAVRTATEQMTLAGFIHEIEGRPSSFYAEPEAWARVLQTHRLDDPNQPASLPRWRFWAAVYSFLAHVLDWAEKAEEQRWSDYVASSRARDLFEDHRRRLRQAQVDLPSKTIGRGAEFLRDFEGVVHESVRWTTDSLYGGS